MPKSAYEATQTTIEDIIKHQRGGLLSIGFITALYFSHNGFHAMINAFNLTSHAIESRKQLTQRLISILLVFITTILLVAAIILIILSEVFLRKIPLEDTWSAILVQLGRIVIIFGLFFCIISFIYYLAPSKKSGWKFVSGGSTVATLLTIILSVGFAFYVNNFGQYNKLYGSIGTLIVILLWLYFNSIVLLLGFELNASIHSAKKHHVIK
jgi:membrane protein